MQDGILLIDKPANMTSFGVVARLRRVLSQRAGKKVKVGHTGTLDPFATGLMILTVGAECKNANKYAKLDKIYETTAVLGRASTTGDPEGDIVTVSDYQPSRDEVEAVIQQFLGKIKQTPPVYSAVKINGKRAYKYARAGLDVEMPEREVELYQLEIISYDYPMLQLRAHVSSGTYIRSLVSDIGDRLSTGAYCQSLRRTSISDFDIKQAKKLADFGIES